MSKFVIPALLLFLLVFVSPAASEENIVLFDTGHGQQFLPARSGDLDLSRLADVFRASGLSVLETDTPFTGESLAAAAGVVISGPFSQISAAEVDALVSFMERGGVLAVMLHIPPPAIPLIDRLGGAVANGVVRESEQILDGDPLNFKVTRHSTHPLLSGIDSFSLYGGWPLLARRPGTGLIAFTSPGAWVDLDRDRQLTPTDPVRSFGVLLTGAVGEGAFALFGDDAIFQNRFLTGNNERLARNLALWFRNGGNSAP